MKSMKPTEGGGKKPSPQVKKPVGTSKPQVGRGGDVRGRYAGGKSTVKTPAGSSKA